MSDQTKELDIHKKFRRDISKLLTDYLDTSENDYHDDRKFHIIVCLASLSAVSVYAFADGDKAFRRRLADMHRATFARYLKSLGNGETIQ